MDLRCPSTLQGVVTDGVLEIKCRNNRCGARSGVVVLHRWDTTTGELLDTKTFRDPIYKEVNTSATRRQRSAVRSS